MFVKQIAAAWTVGDTMPSARLLIVEDDEDMLYTLRRWCSREGYEALCANIA